MTFALRSRRTVTPRGVRDAVVVVEDGRIASVGEKAPRGVPLEDLGEKALLPGIVDTHVHVNEPGRAEWEGFASATRAAAAGGVTSLVDMPLNSIPPTTTLKGLRAKLRAAEGRLAVDCAFWGGVVPGNAAELEPMLEEGVLGFKCFLIDSGVKEFRKVTEKDLRRAMPILARHGSPLLVHAEMCAEVPRRVGAVRRYAGYLTSRPDSWEEDAIRLAARLCRETEAPVHIVHLSSALALEVVCRAKGDGLPLTAETCPHYLTFAAEEVPDGSVEYKCAPPIRDRGNRERLWAALKERQIDFVVSDHSPCLPEMKSLGDGDFSRAWGGISSLQLSLRAVWTEACRRGFGLEDVARWMCERPAAFAGLGRRKGALEPGRDADLVVFDPETEAAVAASEIRHRHRVTPYLGRRLAGKVERTYLRGRQIYDGTQVIGRPLGCVLRRAEESSPSLLASPPGRRAT